jgi:hypothetical protein
VLLNRRSAAATHIYCSSVKLTAQFKNTTIEKQVYHVALTEFCYGTEVRYRTETFLSTESINIAKHLLKEAKSHNDKGSFNYYVLMWFNSSRTGCQQDMSRFTQGITHTAIRG